MTENLCICDDETLSLKMTAIKNRLVFIGNVESKVCVDENKTNIMKLVF